MSSLRQAAQNLAAICDVAGCTMLQAQEVYEEALDLPNTQQHYQRYLYTLIRLAVNEDDFIVETGMEKGASTMQLLWALRDVDANLATIDCSYEDQAAMRFQISTWDVSKEVNKYIDKETGAKWWPFPYRSDEVLHQTAFNDCTIFLHDSDHGYECQTFEYNWAYNNPNVSMILSDDWMWDNARAWTKFTQDHSLKWWTAGHMAIVVK